jgi:hypothetical protein
MLHQRNAQMQVAAELGFFERAEPGSKWRNSAIFSLTFGPI